MPIKHFFNSTMKDDSGETPIFPADEKMAILLIAYPRQYLETNFMVASDFTFK
jgi:hypothetical protein